VGVVVVSAGLFFAFHRGSDDAASRAATPGGQEGLATAEDPAAAESQAAAKAKKAADDAAHAAQRSRLEKLRAKLSDDPEGLLSLRSEIEGAVILPALEDEHQQFVGEVDRRIAAAADRVIADVQKKSEAYSKQENFVAAYELWKEMPEIVRKCDRRARWVENEVRAARYSQAWSLWTKLDKKADEYLGPKDAAEIAIAILECQDNYPKDCETLFPFIWEKRTARVQTLKNSAATARAEIQKREVERRKQEELARLERLDRERQARWAVALEKTAWMPLISREGGDLENWAICTVHFDLDNPKFYWTIQNLGGTPTVIGDNSEGGGVIRLGINGNKWMDWVLEFDVLVEKGSVDLLTRATLAGSGFGDPQVNNHAKELKFAAENDGTWKHVRIEASGNKVKRIEGEKEIESVTTEGRAGEYGGFVFIVDPQSSVKLKEMKVKLIFSDKRKKGEDSGGEDDEDE